MKRKKKITVVAPSGPRLKIGEFVTVLECERPELIGKTGKITTDEQDEQPYKITFGAGDGRETGYYYRGRELRRATPVRFGLGSQV